MPSCRWFHLLALVATASPPGPAGAQAPVSATAPTCRATFDSLDARIRRNYAGFLLEIRGARYREYLTVRRSRAREADTTTLTDCYPILARFAAWFGDPHLFVFQSPTPDRGEATARRAALRVVSVSEWAIREDLATRTAAADPIEGVWYDGALRVGVVPDPDGGPGAFVGVVLRSDTAAWPRGAVRARFHRMPDASYETRLLTREFAELQLTARIYKRTLLRLSPGMWGRAFPLTPADRDLMDPDDVHGPVLSIRQRSVVFSIPSHDPRWAPRMDSLVRVADTAIRTRPLLIIDLRGNEGGASFTTRALRPYVTTLERRATPFDTGAAVMLSSPDQIAYARRFTGTDTTAFVRGLVTRLEARPGQLVVLEEPTGDPAPPEPTIPGNWRVVVLVDRGTVSAAEVLVLQALRSPRALVVGEPTAGALDYQSVNIVGLGTGAHRWALGYPTIAASADLPRRGMRGKGITPHVPLAWGAISDPIGEIERRFAP